MITEELKQHDVFMLERNPSAIIETVDQRELFEKLVEEKQQYATRDLEKIEGKR
jgi:PII-like signaling protein